MSSNNNNLDYYYCSEEEVSEDDDWDEAWDSDDDDEWCREMRLPEAKRRRLDTVTETQPWEEEEEEDDDDELFREMTLPYETRLLDNETDQEGGGGALFEFTLTHGDMPRRWKNVVNKTRHTARLHQRRDVNLSDHLGEALTEALRKALLEATASERGLTDADKMHFTMHATAFRRDRTIAFSPLNLTWEKYVSRPRGSRCTCNNWRNNSTRVNRLPPGMILIWT